MNKLFNFMGIKDLWTILTPFCERKPLFELQGKTVAIDLSGWVCQAQCITEYQVQPKMYLRNLYFRTCYLLMLGVNPVFVLEGTAPTLKHKTIQSRNAVQFKGAKPRVNPAGESKVGKGRTRFHHVLKQCEEMLKLMGLSCITAIGEAEAMCAYLNEKMMVDGCISQDSDCFAYGAKIVYRNFSISQQGVSAASGGSVDVYDIHKAEKAIDFGRQKVIALSLICGSDYNEGVFSVGKEAAMKFFSTIPDREILSRIRSWRSDETLYERLSRDTDIKNNCSQCGHPGNKSKHTRNGCLQCGTSKNCQDLSETNKINETRNELAIRKKALEDPNFPDEDLISEFLTRKDTINHLNLKWKKPDINNFIKFTVKHLQWEDVYCFEKFFPILTRWCAINSDGAPIKPKYIKKKRNPKGVCSYEIIWECECFKGFLQEESDEIRLFSSIEPVDLIERNYPDLVEKFNESKIKPKGRKKKKNDEGVEKTNKKRSGELLKKREVAKRTRKKNDERKGKQPTLTQLLKTNEDLDASCFGDEDDDANLSLVIDGIISHGIPVLIKEKIEEIKTKQKHEFEDITQKCELQYYSQKSESEVITRTQACDENNENNSNNSTRNKNFFMDQENECDVQMDDFGGVNSSHFFGDMTIGEPDLFEKTFNAVVSSSSSSESEDSFDEEYVPLLERLKKK